MVRKQRAAKSREIKTESNNEKRRAGEDQKQCSVICGVEIIQYIGFDLGKVEILF